MSYITIYLLAMLPTLFVTLVIAFVKDMEEELFSVPGLFAMAVMCLFWPVVWFVCLAWAVARFFKAWATAVRVSV
jgi:predicted branched-subunit amino acid permease